VLAQSIEATVSLFNRERTSGANGHDAVSETRKLETHWPPLRQFYRLSNTAASVVPWTAVWSGPPQSRRNWMYPGRSLVVCETACFSLRAFDAGKDLLGVLGLGERVRVIVP